MRITALAGGVGSARLLAGLVRVVDPRDVAVVVNTGDDERIRGLHVCPDIDTVLYHLDNSTDWDQGWGMSPETFVANERYVDLVRRARSGAGLDEVDMQEWFSLGDNDLATHLFRTRLLDAGWTLSRTTDVLRTAMGLPARVLPMSDSPVRTALEIRTGVTLDFQTWFVRHGHRDEIRKVSFTGDRSAAAPGVVEAVGSAGLLLIPPSNPLVSIAPILAIEPILAAVRSTDATRVAVSPIVGGKAIKGPAATLMASLGHEVSPLGVAHLYKDLIDVLVIDEADAGLAPSIGELGIRAIVCDTIMRSPLDAGRLAKTILEDA